MMDKCADADCTFPECHCWDAKYEKIDLYNYIAELEAELDKLNSELSAMGMLGDY